jgi:hypothetical protein
MHWSQRRRERQDQLTALQEQKRVREQEHLLLLLRAQQRELLWELALPLVDSLTRLDKRLLAAQLQSVEYNLLLQEMVMEVLQAQMPPVSQQLGLSTQPPLSPSLGS